MSDPVPATGRDSSVTGARILLENVSKRYPGQARAAVDGLTLEIPAGSTVMLVGPSGCGKTTTLKMINRLIEPTGGRIVIDGRDVTDMNGDELRRGIGYVIQAGGLFPHMSVATNIGMVPKMLGWDRQRIAARVDELLELVSLDPAVYRDRYPRELSGGQQQRVGVARALAADPPVLLMDEPFGAVDPITRQRLQDELINIQHELQKTIVCVTHDFDEAVKLGDWIAVFDEGARVVQYDAPERILAEPADEFVEDFIGSGAGLKQLTLTRVREVDLVPAVTTRPGEDVRAVLRRADEAGTRDVVVVDDRGRPLSWPSRRQLERVGTVPGERNERLPLVGTNSTLNDALDTMLVSSTGAALVVGARDRFEGVIYVETVMAAITEARRSVAAEDAPLGHNTGELPAVDATPGGGGR
ncbi:ABC transporter ATP-binding protein [Kocuria sp. LUK]|uniref:ABC transporter ATP-binding protein n=1 Tax=Kocuria sp. LUK TaxID=2897828 RepID=UPI001E4FAA5F|nr:ABC transporter ATP-binding protein [Kocuria sp. LUK]MCD1145943.1 ABC transporter ATP-binding protein [Kocuria sp. LUK]